MITPHPRCALPYALNVGRQAGGCVTVLHALEYVDADDPPEYADVDLGKLQRHSIDSTHAHLHARFQPDR